MTNNNLPSNNTGKLNNSTNLRWEWDHNNDCWKSPTDLRGLAKVQHHVTRQTLMLMDKYANWVGVDQVYVEEGTTNIVLQSSCSSLDLDARIHIERIQEEAGFSYYCGLGDVEFGGGGNWIGTCHDTGEDQIFVDTAIDYIDGIDADELNDDLVQARIDELQAEAS